eukprot:GHVU01137645.1.p1 GENE.GHVU01137645.1~~GHVU01137645.1.p1  ORF type:complete len:109 (+),score=3.02 GHVU01137645.1:224-550(+)
MFAPNGFSSSLFRSRLYTVTRLVVHRPTRRLCRHVDGETKLRCRRTNAASLEIMIMMIHVQTMGGDKMGLCARVWALTLFFPWMYDAAATHPSACVWIHSYSSSSSSS